MIWPRIDTVILSLTGETVALNSHEHPLNASHPGLRKEQFLVIYNL